MIRVFIILLMAGYITIMESSCNANAIKRACNKIIKELPVDIFKVKTMEKNLCKTEEGDTIVYRTVENIRTEVIPLVTDSTPFTPLELKE